MSLVNTGLWLITSCPERVILRKMVRDVEMGNVDP